MRERSNRAEGRGIQRVSCRGKLLTDASVHLARKCGGRAAVDSLEALGPLYIDFPQLTCETARRKTRLGRSGRKR